MKLAWCMSGLVLGFGLGGVVDSQAAEHRGRQFLSWERFADWESRAGEKPGQRVLVSPPIQPAIAWDEAVLSWNATTPSGTGLKFEVRRLDPPPPTRFYVLGLWASDPNGHPRESVSGQKDDHGEVQTDTLVLREPARTVQLRVTLSGASAENLPRLRFLGLSLLKRRVSWEVLPPNQVAWGRELPVPERTQVIYPEGVSAWCSPTSLAMLLAYWSERLGRPELAVDVPDVARAVHDPQWPGTGNWPFNTAFAGSFPGLRAYVTRLSDVAELEDWVAAGVPVAVSVSYNLLRGQPRDRSDGHLVVVRGFTDRGDVIVNDPGTGREIRREFPRANLIQAWAVSENTVYLVYPPDLSPPPNRFGHW